MTDHANIHSCPELMECVKQVGFLPLLESGIIGYSAESLMAEECRFTQFEDGREYGFGWSLLTTPECLFGKEACQCDRTPEESYQRMMEHLSRLLPDATEKQIRKILK